MKEHDPERTVFEDATEASFERWVRHTLRRRLELAAWIFAAVLVVARGIGIAVLHGTPQNAPGAFWMPVQIAVAIATGVAMRTLPVARTHPVMVAVPFFTALPAAAAAHLSALGGFDGPYFYAAYLMAPMTTSLPFPLRERILMTLVPPLAFVVTFVTAHPEHLPYRMIHIPIVSLVANIVISIVLGHGGYQVTKERHGLASELDRHALEDARRAERRSLARVLHDDFAQLGTAARMELTSLERKLGRQALAAPDLGYLRELLEALDRSSRRIVSNLREAADDESLPARLERMCAMVERGATVTVVRHIEPIEVPLRIREVVFRGVQEALTNALKHAHARTISVSVGQSTRAIVARVADDGRGFDPAARAAGFGLVGMRERVASLGGSLEVESGLAGTTLTLTLPTGSSNHG